MRLLVVEDDRLLGDGLKAGLTQAGFAVDWVQNAKAAELALGTEPYALMVLDIGLPDRSGLDLLRAMRRKADRTPVLILTARDSIPDRVDGLDSGADDYMVKPFDLAELQARVRALLRRHQDAVTPVLRVGDLTLDPASHEVAVSGQPVALKPREFTLLHELMHHAGKTLSREHLERSLYAWDTEPDSNTIEVHIHHLRRKLGADLIRTVRGAGYMIPRGEAQR